MKGRVYFERDVQSYSASLSAMHYNSLSARTSGYLFKSDRDGGVHACQGHEYAHAYVRMYARTSMHTCTCTHKHAHAHVRARTHSLTHARMHKHARTHKHARSKPCLEVFGAPYETNSLQVIINQLCAVRKLSVALHLAAQLRTGRAIAWT